MKNTALAAATAAFLAAQGAVAEAAAIVAAARPAPGTVPFDLLAILTAPRSPADLALAAAETRLAEAAAALDAARVVEREANKCRRCNGRGRIDAYWHHEGGVCFGCSGTGARA